VAHVVTEARLRAVLDNLRRGKIVQNRQLRTLLGEDGYARFLDDWRNQQEVRQTLADKPDEIIEYERRLKTATFAYSKGDAKSGMGRHRTAKNCLGLRILNLKTLQYTWMKNLQGARIWKAGWIDLCIMR
jgi:hypothetical protein